MAKGNADLYAGTTALSTGAKSASQGAATLAAGVKDLNAGAKSASEGATALAGGGKISIRRSNTACKRSNTG